MKEKWSYQKSSYKQSNNPNYRGGKEVPCAFCGKPVYRRPWELKKNKNHFCSTECHDNFRRKPEDENKLHIEDMRGYKHPRWSGPKFCVVCGKELLNRTERRSGTCSKDCSKIRVKQGAKKAKVTLYSDSAGRTTYTCEYCGKIIETTKSEAERSKFCSNKCHILSGNNLRFSRPTSLEIAVAEALIELGLEYIAQYSKDDAPGIYDFYLPSLNLLIEADGEFWHHSDWADKKFNIKERDKIKTEWAINNSYNLIRLREKDVLKFGALSLLQEIFKKTF